MSAVKICRPIAAYCKRGHLKTEASTFPRKIKLGGKTYIARECRECHALREKRRYQRKAWA